MSYHSFPYFAAKFAFNEQEKNWLENNLEKLNVKLGHITKEENEAEKKEILKGKEIIKKSNECEYFIDDDGRKQYLFDLDRNLTLNLCDDENGQGIYFNTSSDIESELNEELVKITSILLNLFLKKFNKSDTIRVLAYITNNRNDIKYNFLFIGAKITKEKIKILNLLDWIFEENKIDLLPEINHIHNY